jgi:hypothetical protein
MSFQICGGQKASGLTEIIAPRVGAYRFDRANRVMALP